MSKRKRELCDEAVDFAEDVGGFAVDVLKTASVMSGLSFAMGAVKDIAQMHDEVVHDGRKKRRWEDED